MTKSRNCLFASLLTIGIAFSSRAQPALSNNTDRVVEIRSATVEGKSMTLRHGTEVNLGVFPNTIVFEFGMNTNLKEKPLRIRSRLDGLENEWKVSNGQMFLDIRFFNSSGDQVSHTLFPIEGESAGWNGSLKTSPLTHRRETVVVPAQASEAWVLVSSAGPPATPWTASRPPSSACTGSRAR